MREGFTVSGVIARLGLVAAVLLLALFVLYELALVAIAAVVVFARSDDFGTSLLVAVGVLIGGQLVLGIVVGVGRLGLRFAGWILFGPNVLDDERDVSSDDHLKLTPEERLRWANREGEFADPRVTPADVVRRRPIPHRVVSPKDIDKLTPEERLRWANREGEFADPGAAES